MIPETCPQCGATTLHGSMGYRMYTCRTVVMLADKDQPQDRSTTYHVVTGALCHKPGEIPLREA